MKTLSTREDAKGARERTINFISINVDCHRASPLTRNPNKLFAQKENQFIKYS